MAGVALGGGVAASTSGGLLLGEASAMVAAGAGEASAGAGGSGGAWLVM